MIYHQTREINLTARTDNDTINAARPRTLANALANLNQLELFILDSLASVGASITRLGTSLEDLGSSINSLQVHNERMTENAKAITTHLDHQQLVLDQLRTAMEAHLEQVNNLIELEKACLKKNG
jgi:hypothetical protein